MNYRGLARIMGVLAALAVLAASPTVAQEEGRWRATPLLGVTKYDESSALKTAPFVGAEAQYVLSPSLRIGLGLNVARPIVDGSYFPLVFLRVHADTSWLAEVGQQVTQFNYMGTITAMRSMGSVNLFGQAGIGGWSFFLHNQGLDSVPRGGGPGPGGGVLGPRGGGVALGRPAALRAGGGGDHRLG